MARSRVVGPDLPSGLRRPDRSVSLPDPREQPVQQMGFGEDASSGRIRTPAPHTDHAAWRRAMGTHNDVGMGRLSGYSEEDIKRWYLWRQMGLDGEFSGETGERKYEVEGENQRLIDEASDEDLLAAEEYYEKEKAEWEEGEAAVAGEEGEAAVAETVGLTADEAFQQHHAMSSGEQPRTDRAHPERPTPPTSREPWVPLSDEQNAINAEGMKKTRETLNGSRNPELRAMDSQMMTDLMAERAAQPEQGYFGGMGNAVQELTETVRAMSGEEQGMMIAALIAAGLLTAGSGGMLAPAGAALMGGAGMAALSQ